MLAAGGGFWGGVAYQKSKLPGNGGDLPAFGNGMMPTRGDSNSSSSTATNGRGAGMMGGGGVSGEVTAKDSTSLTIKMQSGSTQTVYYSDSTKVYQDASASLSDLAVGDSVSVSGTPNSDGSVTAETVRLTAE